MWVCYKLRAHGKVVLLNKSKTPKKLLIGLVMKPQKSLERKLTPKKPLAEFLSLKNFQKTLKWYNMENKVFTKQVWLYFIYLQMYVARICRRYNTDLRIVLNTQKNPYLKLINPPKKILSKISSPKKILQSSLSLEIQSTPPGGSPHYLSNNLCAVHMK